MGFRTRGCSKVGAPRGLPSGFPLGGTGSGEISGREEGRHQGWEDDSGCADYPLEKCDGPPWRPEYRLAYIKEKMKVIPWSLRLVSRGVCWSRGS